MQFDDHLLGLLAKEHRDMLMMQAEAHRMAKLAREAKRVAVPAAPRASRRLPLLSRLHFVSKSTTLTRPDRA